MTDHTTPTRTPPSAEQIRAMTQIMQEAASWHEPRVISIPGMLGPITAGPVRGFREPAKAHQRVIVPSAPKTTTPAQQPVEQAPVAMQHESALSIAKSRAQALRATDPKLTEQMALRQAFREDPGLYRRYREAARAR